MFNRWFVHVLWFVFGFFTLCFATPSSAQDVEKGTWQPIDNIENCEFWNTLEKAQGQATWTGTCENGKIHGQGVLEFKGAIFTALNEGLFDQSIQHGDGTFVADMMRDDGVLRVEYRGGFINGFFSGQGILETEYTFQVGVTGTIKSRYVGAFKDGKQHGKGVKESRVERQDASWGTRYEGMFENGDYGGGQGIFTISDGSTCEGEWKNGNLVGVGKGVLEGNSVSCYTVDGKVEFMN